MADVCEDNNTVYRPNLLKPRTSSLSSRKSDIVRREAMNLSCTTSPPGCEADLVFGKRLHHPPLSGVAFLIFLIIFNIITFPITAVLNALVMISVKGKITTKSAQIQRFAGVPGFDRLYSPDSSSTYLCRGINHVVT